MWVSQAGHEQAASDDENLDDNPYVAGRRRRVPVHVTIQAPKLDKLISIADLNLEYATAQPLPDEELLIVNARAQWRRSGPEQNATVVDSGRPDLAAVDGVR